MKTRILCLIFGILLSVFASAQNSIYDLSLEELLEMEVSVASKENEKLSDAPGMISILTNKEIEVYGALNLGELLNRITSIYHLQGGMLPYNVASIRGQQNGVFDNHILILLNGRPLRDASSGGFNGMIYSSFPVGIIDHLEIIRGPGSALYGTNAFSGVINIVTKTRKEDGITARNCFTAGSFETLEEQVCGIYKKNDLSINFGANLIYDKGENYEFYDASKTLGSGNYEKDGKSVYLNLNYKQLKADFGYFDYQPFYIGNKILWQNAGEIETMQRFFTNLAYTGIISEKLTVETNLTYNGFEWKPDNAKSFSGLLEVAVNYQPLDNLKFIVASVNDYSEWEGSDYLSGKNLNSSVYAQTTFEIAKWAKLIGGFQMNNLGEKTYHFSPRMGLISSINDQISLKILYSNAFRNPSPSETNFQRDNVIGNPELLPETINTLESQIFYQNNIVQLSLTYYNSSMQNLIIKTRNPITGKGEFLNRLEHNFWGLEYEGKINLTDKISFFTSATYQENKNSLEQENASYVPNLMVKMGAFYSSKSFTLGVFDSYFGEPTQSNELLPAEKQILENNPMPTAFHLISSNLSLKLNELLKLQKKTNFTLELYVNNLIGKKIYFPEISINAVNSVALYPGRAFFGKLIIKFSN